MAKIFEGRAEFVDKTLESIGDEMPAKDYAQIMSRVLNQREIRLDGPSRVLRIGGHVRDYIPSRPAHTTRRRQIFAEMQTFATWLGKNVPKFIGLFEAEPVC